ncbi:MAG: hypothetical protein ACI4IV_04675, partial [Acutalibacteraceae bacterium]
MRGALPAGAIFAVNVTVKQLPRPGSLSTVIVCWRLLIASICSYAGLFILDVLLFNVENVIFTAFYGYFLFPLFFIVFGVLSYQKTKQTILPNTIYFLICLLFLIAFTSIGMLFQSNYFI